MSRKKKRIEPVKREYANGLHIQMKLIDPIKRVFEIVAWNNNNATSPEVFGAVRVLSSDGEISNNRVKDSFIKIVSKFTADDLDISSGYLLDDWLFDLLEVNMNPMNGNANIFRPNVYGLLKEASEEYETKRPTMPEFIRLDEETIKQ